MVQYTGGRKHQVNDSPEYKSDLVYKGDWMFHYSPVGSALQQLFTWSAIDTYFQGLDVAKKGLDIGIKCLEMKFFQHES